MYTMIVVDDEMEIRRGFCTYFPWQEIGFEIRADFKSAQEAEEYLKEHQTDVLVTDIRMRGMSGIELIEAVRNASATAGPFTRTTGMPMLTRNEPVISSVTTPTITKNMITPSMR